MFARGSKRLQGFKKIVSSGSFKHPRRLPVTCETSIKLQIYQQKSPRTPCA